MAMRKSQKAIMAARIMAELLDVRTSEVVSAYDNAEEMYLELRTRNFVWDKNLQTWQEKNVELVNQLDATRTPTHASIRIMADDIYAADAVRANLMEIIENAGGNIVSVGSLQNNKDGMRGARAYFEILL